jgi:type I restriction enzyme, S subunit
MTWKKVKLGDILERKKNLVPIEDNKDYKLVTVRLFHKGVTLRKVAKGNELSSNKMHSVTTGEFILSGIDARHGAFGIIPAELEGAVVSNDFWCLSFDKEIIEKQFFLKLTSTTFFDDLCKKASDGTTNRVRLQADKFFNLEITIPPIEEQKDFVQRYSKIEESKHQISTELNHQLALVKELRQAYLSEAMQGKLVPQDESDEPAEILLEKIKAENEKLVAEKRIKRDKPLPPINAEEIPFEIPSNWTCCRLGSITDLITSGSRDWAKYYSSKGAIFVRMGNLSKDSFNLRLNKIQYVNPPKNSEGNRTRLEQNDILVSITGEVGNLGLIPKDFGEAYINQHTALARLNKLIFPKYIAFSFLSNFLQQQFNAPQRGLKNSFRLSDIDFLIVSLPPLAEQERIVAKLEKLMKFCDELEVSIKQGIKNADSLLQVALKEALQT